MKEPIIALLFAGVLVLVLGLVAWAAPTLTTVQKCPNCGGALELVTPTA